MRASEADILVIPGLGGSEPDHWQSRWNAKLATARRVVQADWEKSGLAAWRDRIVEEVAREARPVVLVAHSLGVLAAVHAAPFLAVQAGGMGRRTPRGVMHRYNADGLTGLADRPRPGPQPRLAEAQRGHVAKWVERGPSALCPAFIS